MNERKILCEETKYMLVVCASFLIGFLLGMMIIIVEYLFGRW